MRWRTPYYDLGFGLICVCNHLKAHKINLSAWTVDLSGAEGLFRRGWLGNFPNCSIFRSSEISQELVNESELEPSEKSYYLPSGGRNEFLHRLSNLVMKLIQLSEPLFGFLEGSYDFRSSRTLWAGLFLV